MAFGAVGAVSPELGYAASGAKLCGGFQLAALSRAGSSDQDATDTHENDAFGSVTGAAIQTFVNFGRPVFSECYDIAHKQSQTRCSCRQTLLLARG